MHATVAERTPLSSRFCSACRTPFRSSNKRTRACSSTNAYKNDYACCELTSCKRDGCNCCGRPKSSAGGAPGAPVLNNYTTVQWLSPCGEGENINNADCKLNQSNNNNRNWEITTQHTTLYYQCWE